MTTHTDSTSLSEHCINEAELYIFRINMNQLQEDIFWNKRMGSKWLRYRISAQCTMVSSKGTLVYELTISKKQKNELSGSMDIF